MCLRLLVTTLVMLGNSTEDSFHQCAPKLWAWWAEKPADLLTNMMLPWMFACRLYSRNLNSLLPMWVILSLFRARYLLICWIVFESFRAWYFLCVAQQVGEPIDVCVEDETTRYLNRKDVQHALNARLANVDSWMVCSKYCFLIIYNSSLTDILLTKKVSIFCFYHILSLFGK